MFWDDIKKITQDMIILRNEMFKFQGMLTTHIADVRESMECKGAGDDMKNVDKLNTMINEFKGCVSIARAAHQDRRVVSTLSEDIQLKMDYIYENMHKIAGFMQKHEKKSRKSKKNIKKKVVSPNP